MPDTTEVHELNSAPNDAWEAARFGPSGQDFSLPPVDRGRQAWSFLAVCFVYEAVIWGFPFSFGVFQTFYSSNGAFASDKSGIAAIGTTASGLMYFASPLVMAFMRTYPHLARKLSTAGLIVLLLGLVLASFANNVWQLILTQGAMYAIGGSLLYLPAISYLDEWFVHRKGLAFGIMWAGTGSSGLVCPLVLQWLLSSYGFRTTLRVWAVVCVSSNEISLISVANATTGCTLVTIFVRPQRPSSSATTRKKGTSPNRSGISPKQYLLVPSSRQYYSEHGLLHSVYLFTVICELNRSVRPRRLYLAFSHQRCLRGGCNCHRRSGGQGASLYRHLRVINRGFHCLLLSLGSLVLSCSTLYLRSDVWSLRRRLHGLLARHGSRPTRTIHRRSICWGSRCRHGYCFACCGEGNWFCTQWSA